MYKPHVKYYGELDDWMDHDDHVALLHMKLQNDFRIIFKIFARFLTYTRIHSYLGNSGQCSYMLPGS